MSEQDAEQITKTAKSNLAFAFHGLPAERKRLLNIFYAFCRVVDDIADEPGPAPDKKYADLDQWTCLIDRKRAPVTTLEKQVIELLDLPGIDKEAMKGIIAGCRSDVEPVRYQTLDHLLSYTYLVASCVGIVSATLFGAGREARPYAVALGHALQLTNILRDVGEDWLKEKRIYLPLSLLEKFGYSEEDLQNHVRNTSFYHLMSTLTSEAENFYRESDVIFLKLPAHDRKVLAPARTMRFIYGAILQKMKKDGYDIFNKRYRIPGWRKAYYLLKARLIAR